MNAIIGEPEDQDPNKDRTGKKIRGKRLIVNEANGHNQDKRRLKKITVAAAPWEDEDGRDPS